MLQQKLLLCSGRFSIPPPTTFRFLAFQRGCFRFFSSFTRECDDDSLYRRISPLGDPNVTISPVLDRWVNEGKTVTKHQLKHIVKELKSYRRFKHALEVSHWMDKLYYPPSGKDVAVRLTLIFRVHGMEQMENYFNQLPPSVKGFEVYTSLLNCYVHAKQVEKAEKAFQIMKDRGFLRTPLCWNLLMGVYYHTGNYEKTNPLLLEMKEKGIQRDQYSMRICLNAYAATSDIRGMDSVVQIMEGNPKIVLDWNFYATAADGYLKVGQIDKATEMLKKFENKITYGRCNSAFNLLLRLYARTGNKDELYRIWSLYKQRMKIPNRGYMTMMSMFLDIYDTEAAERIYGDWKSSKLNYDFRVPNLLIKAYCSMGLVKKAESLIHDVITEGNEPSVDAWCAMTSLYIEDNQINKAEEAMRKAVLVCPPKWKPSKEILVSCVEYLEGKGDTTKAEGFIRSLSPEGVFSPIICDRLMSYVKGEILQPEALRQS